MRNPPSGMDSRPSSKHMFCGLVSRVWSLLRHIRWLAAPQPRPQAHATRWGEAGCQQPDGELTNGSGEWEAPAQMRQASSAPAQHLVGQAAGRSAPRLRSLGRCCPCAGRYRCGQLAPRRQQLALLPQPADPAPARGRRPHPGCWRPAPSPQPCRCQVSQAWAGIAQRSTKGKALFQHPGPDDAMTTTQLS